MAARYFSVSKYYFHMSLFIFLFFFFLIESVSIAVQIVTGVVLMSGSSAVAEIIERIKGTNAQG